MKNRSIFWLIITLCFINTHKSKTQESFLKKRPGRVSETSLDIKQAIGDDFKKDLTHSADLIALESKQIKIVAKKTEKLLNNDPLFSGPQAELYEKKLAEHVKKHNQLIKQLEELNKAFEEDFKLS